MSCEGDQDSGQRWKPECLTGAAEPLGHLFTAVLGSTELGGQAEILGGYGSPGVTAAG